MSSLSNYTEWLLFHLWKKTGSDTLGSPSKNIGLLVTNTVIYRWSQPSCWFFTSPDGTLKRKKKEKINSETIDTVMCSHKSKSGILATALYEMHPANAFLSRKESHPIQISNHPSHLSSSKDEARKVNIEVEYLDRPDLSRLV